MSVVCFYLDFSANLFKRFAFLEKCNILIFYILFFNSLLI